MIKNHLSISDQKSEFLDDALSQKYEVIPKQQSYKVFQVEDIDDYPFIQIVAESVNIEKP